MTEFEYIVGFHTIVLGLATAKLLTALSDTLKHRETIIPFWVHSLWCVIAQLNVIGYWYAIWRIQEGSTEFGYAEFLGFFSVSIALYLISSFLSFDLGDDKSIDLEEHFNRARVPTFLSLVYVFAFFVALEVIDSSAVNEAASTGSSLLDLFLAFGLPTLIFAGLIFKEKRAQQVIVVLYAVGYLATELNQAAVGGT